MALGRLSVTVGHKGEASTWHDYVMREGIHAPKEGDKERVIIKEHGNMPYWVKDGDERFFWEMADDKEPYQNGTTYRQHIVSLPRGLTDEQLITLGRKHIDKHNKGQFAYTMAIHCPIGLDGKEQPHLHYMFNEKIIDGIERGADTYFKRYNAKNPHKGGGKKDNTGLTHEQRDIQLQEVRNQWEVTCNEFLAEIGSNERIDMRNWKDRGETERPINISMKAMFNNEVKQAYLDKLNAQANLETAINDLELIDLDTELQKAQTRLAEQIARFEHHQGIQSRLEKLATYDNATLTQAELKPFDKATYDNIVTYEPKALEKINDIITKVNMGEPLSKANETDYRYARAFLNHTAQMRQDGTLEQLRLDELQQQAQAQRQTRLDILATLDNTYLDTADIEAIAQHRYDNIIAIEHEAEKYIQSVIDYAHDNDIEPYIDDYRLSVIELKAVEYLREQGILEQIRQSELAPIVEHEPVIEPPPPELVLNDRQQIAYDILIKHDPDNDTDETKEYFSTLSDNELRQFENPYQSDYKKYLSLVHGYAQTLKDKELDTLKKQYEQLQKSAPVEPTKGFMQSEKSFTKQWNEFIENQRVPHNRAVKALSDRISNLHNFGRLDNYLTQKHYDVINQHYPELAQKSLDYKEFEQFKAEVNYALSQYDRQQQQPQVEQVKTTDTNKGR